MKLKFADAEDKLNTLTLVPENAVDTALLAAIPRSAKVTGARLDVVESSVYAEIRIAPAAPLRLQRRWQARKLRIGFCPGSFVLHYRSVTRGDRYKQGQWLRAREEK